MKISEALRKERKSLGLTQGQMIKESKISVTHYSKMENGQNRIFIDDLILILQLRGISITQFFKKYFPSNDTSSISVSIVFPILSSSFCFDIFCCFSINLLYLDFFVLPCI